MPKFSDHQPKSGYSFVAAIDEYDGANEVGSQVYGDQLESFQGQEISIGVEQFIEHVLRNEACRYRPPDPRFCHLGRSLSCHELETSLEDFLSIEEHTECLIYLSGHGVECREDQQSKGYFAASDTRLIYHNQELVKVEQGLSFDGLETILTNAYRRRGTTSQLKSLLLIIDSCHSGHAISGDRLLSKLQQMYQDARLRPYKDAFSYGVLTSSLGYQQGYVDIGMSVFTKALIDTLCKQDNGPITFEQIAFRLAGGDITGSANRQVSKTAHAGRLEVMAYPGLTTPKKPENDKYGTPINPYQGLKPFTEDSARFFFGRQDVVADLLEKLEQQDRGLLLLAGASGSGKSSVAKAGLLPRLSTTRGYDYHVLDSFGRSPLSRLKNALNTLLETKLDKDEYKNVVSLLQEDLTPKSMEEITSALPQTKNLALYVDQLEEALLPSSSTDSTPGHPKHQKQLDLFLNLLAAARKPLQIIASIRSDFLDACLQNEHLHRLIQYGNCVYYMPPLVGADLREAITAPAVEQGWEIAPSLVKQLEIEVGREAGSLPLLSFALAKLWDHVIQGTENGEKRQEVKTTITLKDYESLGKSALPHHVEWNDHLDMPAEDIAESSGLQSILNNYADLVFTFADWESSDHPEHPRSEKARQWIEQIFLQLIRPSDDTKDTSKPCLRRDLLFTLECASETEAVTTLTKEDLNELLDQLVESRLLTEDVVSGKSEIRLAHEALIDGWVLFRGWRSNHRDLLRLREQLQQQRRLWEESGRDGGYLLTKGLVSQITETPLEKLRPFLQRLEDQTRPDEEYYLISKEYLDRQETALRNALTDARLRLMATNLDAYNDRYSYNEALTTSIGMAGQNLEHMPSNILGPVQKLLTRYSDAQWYSNATQAIRYKTSEVWSVAFSPDGQAIAAGGHHGTIRLWSLDGTPQGTFKGHSEEVMSVAFSPNGQIIASGSSDKTIRVWGLDGSLLQILEGHTKELVSVAFSPDGQLIASGSADKTIRIWSLDGSLLRTLEGHQQEVISVAFSPDGQLIASGSIDKTIRLWSLDGNLLRTMEGHNQEVVSVAFSPDGQLIASGSFDKTIRLWSLDGNPQLTIEGHSNAVRSVAFSTDGQIIVSGSFDKTVRLWSLDGTPKRTIEAHSDSVNSVCFCPGGHIIASGSKDKTVRLWSLEGSLLHTIDGHRSWVNSIALSPDGQIIASGSDDKTIRLWGLEGKLLHTLKGHSASVACVAFSPDGQAIASAGNGNSDLLGNGFEYAPLANVILLWSLDGALLRTLEGHTSGVSCVAFSPDGQTIASGSGDKTIRLWSLDGTLLHTLEGHMGWVSSVAFSPDGQIIASGSSDKTIRLWSLKGTPLRTLEGGDTVNSVAFSPDGQVIASGHGVRRFGICDYTIRLWSLYGTLLHTLEGHRDIVNSVAFSPDGQFIASGSSDKSIRVWRPNGTLLTILEGHSASILSVVFCPDSQTLASSSGDIDNTIVLWKHHDTHSLRAIRRTIGGESNKGGHIAFSPDARTIASVHLWGIRLWTLEGTLLHNIEMNWGNISCVAFSPDRQIIASCSSDETIRLWSIDGILLRILDCHVKQIIFSPDGMTFASFGSDNNIKLWRLDGTLLRCIDVPDWINHISFSHDGKSIACVYGSSSIGLWTPEGSLLLTLQSHGEKVISVSFSPDGQFIASTSYEGTIRLWSLDGSPLRTIVIGNGSEVSSVVFSPDGQMIASKNVNEDTIRLWSLDGTLLRTLEGHGWRVTNYVFSPDAQLIAIRADDGTIWLWPVGTWRTWLRTALQCLGSRWDHDKLGWAARTRLREQACSLVERESSAEAINQALVWLRWAFTCGKTMEFGTPAKPLTSSEIARRSNALLAPLLARHGTRLARNGMEDEAIAMFNQAQEFGLTIDPIRQARCLSAAMHWSRGVVDALKGETKLAAEHFSKAVRLDEALGIEPDDEANRIATASSSDRTKFRPPYTSPY
jgi:WD40 repeat protein